MTKKSSMRTKVERNCKKMAPQKANFSLPSPKVVLNADDCARLLDNMGKTSVLLVEKEAQVVTATSRSTSVQSPSMSPPLVVPSKNVTSTFGAATQTKMYKNWTSLNSTSSTKHIEGSDTTPPKRSSTDGTQIDHPNSTVQSRTFLTPPKKRRGIEKKFEETTPTPIVCNSGEVVHCVASFAGHLTDSASAQISSDASLLTLPLNDELSKHRVEHLLQHQLDLPVNINNNQKQVSGTYSHSSRPYVSSSNNLPTSSSEDVTSVSLSSSALINLDSYNGRTAYTSQLYTHHPYSAALQPSYNHAYLNHPGSVHCAGSLPLSHLVAVGKTTQVDNFQQLPEQIEPMNLSTSCKPVVGLVSLQASSTTDSQTVEDVSAAILQHSFKHVLTESNYSFVSTVSEESKFACEGTATETVNPQDELPETAQDMANLTVVSSDLHNTQPVHDHIYDCVRNSEKSDSESFKSSTALDPSVGSQLSHKVVSAMSVEVPYEETKTVPLPASVQNPVVEVSSGQCVELNDSSPLGQNTQISPLLMQSSESSAPTILASSNLSQELHTPGDNNLRKDCKELSMGNESATVKKNKKTPRKKEIPMDEVSCSDRIQRYSLTIDDVIANFVYIPEPVEEFSLTEEEEAAIRNQFETVQDNSKTDSTDDNMTDNQTSITACGDSTISSFGMQTGPDEPSVGSDSLVTARPPKKRPTVLMSEKAAESHQELQQTVEHIDSVLAFVATDYSSSVLPAESSCSSDSKKQKKLKKKLSGDLSQEDSKRKKVKSENSCNKTVAEENTGSANTSICLADEDTQLKNVIVSSEKSHAEDTGQVSKPKKVKKRKSENTGHTQSLHHAVKLAEVNSEVSEENIEPCVKKATVREKVKSPKKKKTDNILPVDCVTSLSIFTTNKDAGNTVRTPSKRSTNCKRLTPKKSNTDQIQVVLPVDSAIDKEGVCQNRAETSDIGESIASTSGGSEQNTPVHEPESKDEITSTDPQMTDKENHDTGLESGGDDTVRRYKKRLDFVKCDQCSHQARGRSALSRHMKKVHMLDVMMPFRCEHCNYGSTKMASLNRHLFTHGVFPCSRCSFVATERVKLTEHTAEQHKDKLDVRMCKVCNRYIKCDKMTIEQHTVQCQGPKPYRCTECEKEFKYASSLRVHYHTHFPDQPKRFKCEQCDYRTNYKANLHKHNKNMHASRDHDVQCPDCGKLFSTEDNMKRHRKVHTLNRPFSCGTCEKKFKTSGALKGHQLIHTATRPYPCNIPGCSRTFRTPKFLKSHQEEFHHLIPKKFFCSVEGCNYSFFKRSHLKRHTITHTGERNFHCTWPGCSKSFRHSDNLKVHFRAHTNEKPFQCHLCDFKCKQKNSLFWHKKRVHQIVDFSVSQIHMEVKLKPATIEHHLKKVDAASDVTGTGIDQAVLTAAEKASETFVVETVNEVARVIEEVVSDKICKDSLSLDVAETAHLPASFEHDFKTVAGPQEEPGSLDLYEFKSDDESGDEGPGSFRRDKSTMNGLTPLPPPPKELLRRNEILEMKEKEKKEKAEKREQERKEKAERKEQEKNERAEKKNLEKKVKAELKELEKQEKLKKIEQEKKEKIEKKELEKKEKDEKKELEKKEKLEKKELDKKGKIEKKELKKKEQIEKKQQELKEKIEKREQEKREKAEKREQEKKEKLEKKLTSKVCPVKKGNNIESRDNDDDDDDDDDDDEEMENRTKSCSSYSTRRKSPVPARESVTATRKLNPGRKKLLKDTGKSVSEKSVRVKAEKKTDASSFKKKVLSSKKGEPKKSSFAIRSLPRVRSVARKVKRVALKRNLMRRCKKKGKLSPPKRKPSARIKANNKAKTTVTKQVRGQKPASSGLHTRKSVRKKAGLIYSEVDEVESKAADSADVSANTDDQSLNKSEEIQAIIEDNSVLLNSDHEKSLAPPVRSSSPASSEEVMLQGKASPYRDFSDTDNQEEQTGSASSPLQKSPEYPDVRKLSGAESDSSTSEESDNETVTRHLCQPAEEFSDDEVSNDIPLTPPRAPAPPPVESSEDELELEPESTPFSVPGPSTPFSVPGPNTPFSIPPPTNLMQQHSVHSEDAPMSAVLSVPPVDVHSQGSLDMQQSLESAEMHPHGSVEMSNSHGSVEMHHPPGSAEIPDSHNSMTIRSHKSVEVLSHGSVEMVHSHGSVEMLCHGNITESVTHADQHVRTPDSIIRGLSNNSESAKYELPHSLQEQTQTDADKEYFDQYLKNLSAANNRAAIGLEPSPNGLQHLEAMVCKSHLDPKEMSAKSPISCLPTSVITSLESLPLLTNGDLRARMDSLVLDRHHESFYTRETPSSLPRLPDHQTPLSTSAMGHSPAFDAFSSLNSLTAANAGRENSYLRQPENLFSTPPVTSTFIAEAMFQRQAMATPFLPPQPSERSSLSRIPDASPLRSSSSSSFLRRSGTVPGPDMFSSPAMAQNMPRHPFANAWTSQEVRPAHWQTPYLAHQSNMAATGSFFPSKDNYLTGRDFMFDPSVRPSAERSMFSSISSSQSQDSYQLDRFDLSNYFPNAMTPYGSSTASLEYSRTAHAGTAKPFDERYRQTAASAAISDFRGLPPAGGSSDMFPAFPSVNTGFNLYTGNAMSYHAPHMTENVNSAFLTHSTSAQQAMFERDYAAAAAHRSFYPQNTPYPFVDERQYHHSTSKLGQGHPVAPTPVPQERDLISRSAAAESQMQDPYRSLLYRY